ncbi:hypothetical protein AGMMS50268_15860 [Spirochaetia bacterium]|nr:hypothetical protein AGMMS50268_15860 [Spirochaetia bacterium]
MPAPVIPQSAVTAAATPAVELFSPLPPDIRSTLENVLPLIEKTFPIPSRFKQGLPGDVAELSRLLTSGRGDRGESYLGKPPLLSAYLRYFLPWNLYRLCRLLPSLDLHLAAGDAITDLGSGPLTLPAALWLSRPELRSLPLEFRCIDRTGAVMEAGKKLFAALVGVESKWTIKTIKADIRKDLEVRGNRAALVTAVNVFNELLGHIPHTAVDALHREANEYARLLTRLAGDTGRILVMEPGVPRSGEFISALRTSLSDAGRPPLSPCPHANACPLPGGLHAKWCHFNFDTIDAPEALHKLSAAAGIPKERAVLSFLFAGPAGSGKPAEEIIHADTGTKTATPPTGLPVRVISDAFPVPPGQYGRYGCSGKGLILATGNQQVVEKLPSGALVNMTLKGKEKTDPRSGAIVAAVE